MMIFPELYKLCRLCFINAGENDVTSAPILLETIKNLYDVEIKSTDKYTTSICGECTNKVKILSWHKKRVESGQSLFDQMKRMADQMSHMKIEPGPDMDKSQNDSRIVDKQEEENDDDLDDQITEAAPSPPPFDLNDEVAQITGHFKSVGRPVPRRSTPAPGQRPVREPESELEPEPEKENRNQKQNTKEKDKENERNEERNHQRGRISRNDRQPNEHQNERQKNDKNEHRNTRSDDHWEFVEPENAIGARIKIRRSTMVADRPNSPAPVKVAKKRRLSANEQVTVVMDTTNQSQTTNENHSNGRAKKMKIYNGEAKKQTSSNVFARTPRQSQVTPGKLIKNAQNSIETKLTTTSTPSTSNLLKNRNKKFKSSTITPPITQFFSHKPMLRCETCAVTLKSQSELNFHLRIHKKGKCGKCRETIDNQSVDNIHKHMISCLFLGNEIPKAYLTHLLKVKVDLQRLTHDKIEKIQKTLSVTAHRRCGSLKKPAPKSKQHEKRTKGIESNGTNQSEQGATEKSMNAIDVSTKRGHKIHDQSIERVIEPTVGNRTENLSEKTTDEANTTNGDDVDKQMSFTTPGRKQRTKKMPNKSKSTQNDSYEELMITDNQSAALNWYDESFKEKPFTLRNFETDKPIYLNMRGVSNDSNGSTKEKLMRLIKTINNRKEQAINNAPEIVKKSCALDLTTPSTPIENGNNRISSNVPAITVQSTLQTQTNNSSPIPAQMPQQVIVTKPAIVSKPVSQQVIVSNTVVTATATPEQPMVITPSTATMPTVPAQCVANTLILPQLLSLPSRVPHRNRAMSVHASHAEYSAASRLSARRKSVCENNRPAEPKSCSPTINNLSKGIALDHAYANGGKLSYRSNLPKTVITAHQPPPAYITQVHSKDFLQNSRSQHIPVTSSPQIPKPAPTPTSAPIPTPTPTTLKVLTPDDLNSRVNLPAQASPNARIDSPNSTENHTNLNNNQFSATKRPRLKMTPMRAQAQAQSQAQAQDQPQAQTIISDDADISIAVSLSKLGNDHAELILTLPGLGRLNFDDLTSKRKQEVQCSLLKDDVWLKMLNFLKKIKPTHDTIQLFGKILPQLQHDRFIGELRIAYGPHFGKNAGFYAT